MCKRKYLNLDSVTFQESAHSQNYITLNGFLSGISLLNEDINKNLSEKILIDSSSLGRFRLFYCFKMFHSKKIH